MRNTSGLKRHRADRSLACEARVLEAIAYFQTVEGRVTYKAVAQQAKVDVSYFRTHPELKAQIKELIDSRRHSATRYRILCDRIAHLETELKKLKTRHEKLRSHYKEAIVRSDRDEVWQVKQQNQWLELQLQELREDLLLKRLGNRHS